MFCNQAFILNQRKHRTFCPVLSLWALLSAKYIFHNIHKMNNAQIQTVTRVYELFSTLKFKKHVFYRLFNAAVFVNRVYSVYRVLFTLFIKNFICSEIICMLQNNTLLFILTNPQRERSNTLQ